MSVTTRIENGVAIITMDDGKANAINFDMVAALNAALDLAERDAKAVVLAGRSGRFSGGFDLKAFATLGPSGVTQLLDQGAELLVRLYSFPLPLVAACTGHAIAMGVFILHACDIRVGASGDFKLGANETINDMTLPIFAIELSRDRLNPAYLTRAMIQAEIFDPAAAVTAGYLDMIVPLEAVETQAIAIASQLAALPTQGYSANKLVMRGGTLGRIKASIGAHHG